MHEKKTRAEFSKKMHFLEHPILQSVHMGFTEFIRNLHKIIKNRLNYNGIMIDPNIHQKIVKNCDEHANNHQKIVNNRYSDGKMFVKNLPILV